ncbi:MAG: hypothetical protein KA201_03880 [Kofleriaceae bacterium]|nr:hypothetical protein [Kofleriaceae bacterium]
MLTARQFATDLCAKFARDRKRHHDAESWTAVMAETVAQLGEAHGLVAYGHGAGGTQRHREYLWDYTLYADRRDGALPAVVIEHENQHRLGAFRDDFWKILMANAPVRVAIGYCKTADERAGWVEQLNDEAATGVWDASFLGACEDLIALGYWGMLQDGGNFQCWVRPDRGRRWLPYPAPEPQAG